MVRFHAGVLTARRARGRCRLLRLAGHIDRVPQDPCAVGPQQTRVAGIAGARGTALPLPRRAFARRALAVAVGAHPPNLTTAALVSVYAGTERLFMPSSDDNFVLALFPCHTSLPLSTHFRTCQIFLSPAQKPKPHRLCSLFKTSSSSFPFFCLSLM